MTQLRVLIQGDGLPGLRSAAGANFAGRSAVRVGVQRRAKPGELLDLQPGDAEVVRWAFDAELRRGGAGWDLLGPYVQGGPGGRFIYLSWGEIDAQGGFAMFRRAKLMIEDIDPAVLDDAEASGVLAARLPMRDAVGRPICARVRPPTVRWSAPRPVG